MNLGQRRAPRWRLLVHPLAILGLSVLVGLGIGAWGWVARGVSETVVTQFPSEDYFVQTAEEPEVERPDPFTYIYDCPQGQTPGTSIRLGARVVSPWFPNLNQSPEYVACFERVEGADMLSETQFRGPRWDDALLAAVVALVAYFLAVAFILSFRALGRAERD